MEKQIQQQELLMFHPKTSFTVLSKGRVVNIPFEEITHVSKNCSEVIIHTVAGMFSTLLNLQQVLNDLPVNEFFRIHRSHIVSLKFMTGVRRKAIKIGEDFLPISLYYKVRLLSSLGRILERDYAYCIGKAENSRVPTCDFIH